MTKIAPFPYNQNIVSNYIVDTGDTGAGNDKWTSTTVQTYTVPTGKRWLLWGGSVFLSDNATLVVDITDGTNTLMNLATYAATTGWLSILETANLGNWVLPIIMDPAWTVKITCGAAQGATAKATCVVTEYTHV